MGTCVDVHELKSVLLDHEEDLARELVSSILNYALGRTIEFSDMDDVDAILANLREEEFRVGSMVREVALSPLFRRK